MIPKEHLSSSKNASKIAEQALPIVSIYVGANLLILENTASEGNLIQPGLNVSIWQLSCNYRPLTGPEFNTNTVKQLRGAMSGNFHAILCDTFVHGSMDNCVRRMTGFELTANSALHLA